MQFYKCDRCGQVTDHLTGVATTIPKPETWQEKEQKETALPYPFNESASLKKTVSLEICDDCVKILIRWLSHPENYLMKEQELGKIK